MPHVIYIALNFVRGFELMGVLTSVEYDTPLNMTNLGLYLSICRINILFKLIKSTSLSSQQSVTFIKRVVILLSLCLKFLF